MTGWTSLGVLASSRSCLPGAEGRNSGAERPMMIQNNAKSEYNYVSYETLDDGKIARIMLNRPESRNAQHRGLLVDLNDGFLRAEADDQVRVVILGGVGPIFSSGHDMGSAEMREQMRPGPNQHETWKINGGTRLGAEKRMLQEWHYFFENTKRWRNLRKITIAQVQGTVYAAGLMLMWACDLIVGAENARFADVVGTRLGMCGVEYFAHPWEFGPRKTKELMLTGDAIDVDEAHRLGMVSKVFPTDELSERTVEFAERIAALPTMSALLIKESVNQSVDNMGFQNALAACFTIHQLNHTHWAEVHDDHMPMAKPEDGIASWKEAPPVVLATKTEVRSNA
jgi:enoyl-CoA hydratase